MTYLIGKEVLQLQHLQQEGFIVHRSISVIPQLKLDNKIFKLEYLWYHDSCLLCSKSPILMCVIQIITINVLF